MKIYPKNLCAFCLTWSLLITTLSLSAPIVTAQDYTITNLPLSTVPAALNSSGDVTGFTDANGSITSFFWSRTSGLQILAGLGLASFPYAMNDHGMIVGEMDLSNSLTHAFLWTPSDGAQDLGSPLGGNSTARVINNSGEVAGITFSPGGLAAHAFFWSSSTGAIDLGVEGVPVGINSSGEVVGFRFAGGGGAFRWTQATGVEDLVGSYARAVNDSGQISGVGTGDGALWLPDGTVQDLGTLPGDGFTDGLFINDAGHIAGFSRPSACCGKQHTFFWTPGAGMVDIGLLPNHLTARSVPAGFNNRDQIVGSNGATYFWSSATGLRQISSVKLNKSTVVTKVFNDAGQFVGFGPKDAYAVLATPTMHVAIGSSQNPSQAGQSIAFTANVSAIVGLPPDGEQVTFRDGTNVLGTGTLNGGTASFTTALLTPGKHAITANYAGDTNYLPNKSVKLIQTVNP